MSNRNIPGILLVISFLGCDATEPESSPPTTEPAPALEAVAYDVIGQGKLVFQRTPSDGRSEAVYVVDADTRTSWGLGGFYPGPCVSPDGEKIAYVGLGTVGTSRDVFVMDMHGGSRRNVAPIPGNAQAPSWTPDSRHIVYSSNSRIYIDTTQLYSPSPSPGFRVSASASLDLLFPGKRGIDRLNAGASSAEVWIGGPVSVAAWSPDDKQIAYISLKEKHTLQLWIMDEDRDNQRLVAEVGRPNPNAITFSGHNDWSIAWSPDGSRLAFSFLVDDLVSHIYIAASDGSWVQQVTTAAEVVDRSVSWSR